jgi:hypothetical protein
MNTTNQITEVQVLRELNLAEIEEVSGGTNWSCTVSSAGGGTVSCTISGSF